MATIADLEARVSDLAAKEGQAAGRLAELRQQLDDETNDAGLGVEAARGRADGLRDKLAKAEAALEAATRELTRARDALGRQQRAEAEAAEQERQRSVPRLAKRCQQEAEDIEAMARELAARMNQHARTCAELATAIGGAEATRLLGIGAIAERFQYSFFNVFVYDVPRTEAEQRLRGVVTPFHWLPWTVNTASPDVKTGLADKVRHTLDHIVRIFDSEPDARATAERLGEASRLHAVPALHGLFRLLPGKLRGEAARQRADKQTGSAAS